MNHLVNSRRIAMLLSMSLVLAGAFSEAKANEPAAKKTADSTAAETGDRTGESTAAEKRPRRRRPLKEREAVDFGPRTEVYLENGLKKERTVRPFDTKNRDKSVPTEPAEDFERATVSAKSPADAASISDQQSNQTSSTRTTWIVTISTIALILCVVFWLTKNQSRLPT